MSNCIGFSQKTAKVRLTPEVCDVDRLLLGAGGLAISYHERRLSGLDPTQLGDKP